MIPTAIDFETEGIEYRPVYPPKPVGVGILEPGKRPIYLAWGHPTENNSTENEAREVLAKHWDGDRALLFHNAKFDLDVANTWLGLPIPHWDDFHDTMLSSFLRDPNSKRLSLKELGEDLLGIPPNERDEVKAWIMANVPEAKGKPKTWTDWGAYICRAPGKLVGRYCKQDVRLTRKLHDLIHANVLERGMGEAYDRERRLLPHLLSMERAGIPIDRDRLAAATGTWELGIEAVDGWVRQRLKARDLDVDSNARLADALEAAGKVTEWIYTKPSKTFPCGQRSTSWDNLEQVIDDADLLAVLRYRAKLTNGVRTFARPWLAMSETEGKIYCTWNQVVSRDERKKSGARTGRLSSKPNLQNIPKKPPPVVFGKTEARRLAKVEDLDLEDVVVLPKGLRGKVVDLPNLRDFIVPDAGEVLLNPDYKQQELRILAHYEDGALLEAYLADPDLDQHEHARQLINQRTGRNYARKPIKNTGFGIIYGMGLKKLASAVGEDPETKTGIVEAKFIRNEYKAIFPGLKAVDDALKMLARSGEPLRTWGGRLNYCEPPMIIKGRVQSFEYKMLNTLIQGSAADNTKEAIIRYCEHPKRRGRLLLTVHDEFLVSAPKKYWCVEAALLKDCLESVGIGGKLTGDYTSPEPFDLNLPCDMKTSASTWARGEIYDAA